MKDKIVISFEIDQILLWFFSVIPFWIICSMLFQIQCFANISLHLLGCFFQCIFNQIIRCNLELFKHFSHFLAHRLEKIQSSLQLCLVECKSNRYSNNLLPNSIEYPTIPLAQKYWTLSLFSNNEEIFSLLKSSLRIWRHGLNSFRILRNLSIIRLGLDGWTLASIQRETTLLAFSFNNSSLSFS